MKTTTEILNITNLSKYYGKKKIFADLNFNLAAADWLGIIGSNGSGKSTLVKTIIGLEKQTNGDIFLNGINTKRYNNNELFSEIQLISQYTRNALDPLKKIFNTLCEPLMLLKGYSKTECLPIIKTMFRKCNLEFDLLEKRPRQLSGGQYQRICIVRALIIEPSLLICDEATASLDVINELRIIKLLKSYPDMAVIFISHNKPLVKQNCNSLLNLDK